MSTVVGRRAEQSVTVFLERKGCKIVERNWRTRWCEIDIIAERHSTIYFCEVKYRSNYRYGRGIEYITPQKVAQMRFAAELWMGSHAEYEAYELVAVEVSGPRYQVTRVVKDLY